MSPNSTVLVVEDNPVTRKMLRIALETEGYAVIEVADGRSALAAADQKLPDLVLQDLILPDMNGLELLGALRALVGGAALPIVALSGFTGQMEESKLTRAGFTAVLVKPVEPSRLIEAIAVFLPRALPLTPVGDERRVLVVDDDPIQLKLMRIHLRERGFKVTTAESATEALRVAQKHVPAIIVSDVLMPDVDGFQLCLEVRRSGKLAAVPVLLVSAHYQTDTDRDLARRVGANGLALRTPDLDEIVPAMLKALGAGAPPPTEEQSDIVKLAHAKAVIRQLERQVTLTSGLARRCTLQAAQLSLLGGIADALARNSDFSLALRDVLAATLDAAAISKGALMLREGPERRLTLKHAIGFSDTERAGLETFFGEMAFLERIVERRMPISIPSPAAPHRIEQAVVEGAGVMFFEIVPLVSEGEGMGTIILGARRTDVTSEDSIAFARAIGNQIVQSLEMEASFRRLAESEKRHRTLMESANDGILIFSPEGVIREANRRFEDLVGIPKDRIVGHRLEEFVVAEVDSAEQLSDAVEIKKQDGSSALLQFSNTAIEVGTERLVLSIGRDITDQARARTQLMVSDRMASVGMLASGVAHEINNPLSAVTGNLEIARQELESAKRRCEEVVDLGVLEEVIGEASEAADRVRSIVRDLKIFSRAEEERRVAVDIHRILDSSLRMAWTEIRHRARLTKQYGKVPPVLGNESRLGQVFLNLIVNAAQAIPEGHADKNEICVRTSTQASDGSVVIEVADTGPGIPSEVLKKLFTPFFTTKPEGVGTGLGLTICQRIVTALGGEISVTSEADLGTVFKVVLPPGAPKQDVASPSAKVIRARRRGRILVVDDEAPVAAMVRRVLASEHQVEVLTNAVEALRRIEDGARFDVILCDLMMPVMPGMEFHTELARTAPDQAERIVFLTGGAFTANARVFLDHVSNPRLDKPFQIQTLRQLVNERLQ